MEMFKRVIGEISVWKEVQREWSVTYQYGKRFKEVSHSLSKIVARMYKCKSSKTSPLHVYITHALVFQSLFHGLTGVHQAWHSPRRLVALLCRCASSRIQSLTACYTVVLVYVWRDWNLGKLIVQVYIWSMTISESLLRCCTGVHVACLNLKACCTCVYLTWLSLRAGCTWLHLAWLSPKACCTGVHIAWLNLKTCRTGVHLAWEPESFLYRCTSSMTRSLTLVALLYRCIFWSLLYCCTGVHRLSAGEVRHQTRPVERHVSDPAAGCRYLWPCERLLDAHQDQ